MALKVLREAIDLGRELTRGGWLPWSEIARIHEHLGDALWRASRQVEALDAWREALVWWRRLSKKDGRYRANVITLRYRMGAFLERRGDGKHALETYDHARRLARELDRSSSCTCHRSTIGESLTPIREQLAAVRSDLRQSRVAVV
jgi:tetratricopeptide (TPR) repeat protein